MLLCKFSYSVFIWCKLVYFYFIYFVTCRLWEKGLQFPNPIKLVKVCHSTSFYSYCVVVLVNILLALYIIIINFYEAISILEKQLIVEYPGYSLYTTLYMHRGKQVNSISLTYAPQLLTAHTHTHTHTHILHMSLMIHS